MHENLEIVEGKTKIVYQSRYDNDQVFIESKDTITAGDGAKSAILPNKGRLSTITASNVFRLLTRNGLENHFIEQASPKRFRAQKLDMIPLEVVVRRYAYGSFLKRNPALAAGQELNDLTVEFFAKDDARHDPLVRHNFKTGLDEIYDALKPQGHESLLGFSPNGRSKYGLKNDERSEIVVTAQSVFQTLESSWENEGYMLVDIKMEFGRNRLGQIVLGDVVHNDEWRLWKNGDINQMVDKQLYREGRPLSEVAEAYQEVANASHRLLL